MELLSTLVNAAVIAVVGGLFAWFMGGRFKEVDRRFKEIDRRFDEVDRRFEKIERRMDGFQTSLDAMRSDLTQVALAVGVRPRASEGGR